MGIYLSSTLSWSLQIEEECLKANRKLSVLRSVKLLSRQTLDMLLKITVRAVIDYALPVHLKTSNITEIARCEQIQYKTAKVVTGALHFTSQNKLNTELGIESNQKRSHIFMRPAH